MENKHILITGGAGFIGRNLIKYLLEQNKNIHIHIFDTFISSNENEFLKFKKTIKETKVTLYKFDISDPIIKKISIKFDEIYHLASLASPIFYKKYPLETLDCGYIGTKNILEIAKVCKSKVLFASTSEVYGDPEVSPQNEDYYGNVNSFGARCIYDESKRVAEALCYTYIKEFGLDIKIARIFNTYGENMMLNDGRIVTEAIKHLMNNSTLTIFGDGMQTRSLCYVYDTVNMLVQLMNTNCNTPVNIGNDIELTINEIVDTIEKVYQEHFEKKKIFFKLKREYIPLTQNDPLKRKPCLLKNKEILNQIEYTNINAGIKNTIKYFINE